MSNQINGGKPLGAFPKNSSFGRPRDEVVDLPRNSRGRDMQTSALNSSLQKQVNQESAGLEKKAKPKKKRWNKHQKRDRKEESNQVEQGGQKIENEITEKKVIEKKFVNMDNATALFKDPAILSINVPPSLKLAVNKPILKLPVKQATKAVGIVLRQRGPSNEDNQCIPSNTEISVTLTPIQRFLMDLNSLKVLEKRSQKHPKAQFVCTSCQYYCDTMAVVEKHITAQRHKDSMMETVKRSTIEYMPAATDWQLIALTAYVEKTYSQVGMSSFDYKQRTDVVEGLNSIISRSMPSCSVRLYGSSATKMGLKSSDINMDLVVPADQIISKIMLAVTDLISTDRQYQQVECNLNADWPAITFLHVESKLRCSIGQSNQGSYDTTMLLAQYEMVDKRVRPLAAAFRLWASICKIDRVDLGCWPSYAFSLLLVYYLQQLDEPVLPVLHELTDVPNPDKKPNIYLAAADISGKWKTKNCMTLGELWLGLFRFYVHDFACDDVIVCIQQKAPLKRSTKKWTGRKLAMEDPFLQKRNVSRSIVNMITFDFIMNCFQVTYKYFAIPNTPHGTIFTTIMEEVNIVNVPLPIVAAHLPYDSRRIYELMASNAYFSANGIGRLERFDNLVVTPELAATMLNRFNPSMLTIAPSAQAFCGVQTLPIVCCICQQEGHLREQCPDEELPPIVPLPDLNPVFEQYLTQICLETYASLSPTEVDMRKRLEIVKELEKYLIEFYPSVMLELFGSSCNGFGLNGCDLDICFTYKNNPTGNTLNFANIVEEMHGHLRKSKIVNGLVAITTAKVPILKFVHVESKLEGDISIYNTLAQRNTKMLRAYADIDPRVQMLGFMLKKLAKFCDICDASRGSLSSYAYILLVIFYLQRCDPPVLPNLQQLRNGDCPTASVMVEGYNTYFFEEIDQLGEVWPGYNKNTASIGRLWLDLLDFYAARFDYKSTVISIRQLEVLPRYVKMWNTKSLAIEDPFDLTHNLGAGLSRKMHMYVLKTLIKARSQFGLPMNLRGIPLEGYFFNKQQICDGSPPNDRGCRICKKIGHQAKDCQQKKPGNWRDSPRRQEATPNRPRAGAARDMPRPPPNSFMAYQGGPQNPHYRVNSGNGGGSNLNYNHRINGPGSGLTTGHPQPMTGYNPYQPLGYRQHAVPMQQQTYGAPDAMFSQDRADRTRQTVAMANKFHLNQSRRQW